MSNFTLRYLPHIKCSLHFTDPTRCPWFFLHLVSFSQLDYKLKNKQI